MLGPNILCPCALAAARGVSHGSQALPACRRINFEGPKHCRHAGGVSHGSQVSPRYFRRLNLFGLRQTAKKWLQAESPLPSTGFVARADKQ